MLKDDHAAFNADGKGRLRFREPVVSTIGTNESEAA